MRIKDHDELAAGQWYCSYKSGLYEILDREDIQEILDSWKEGDDPAAVFTDMGSALNFLIHEYLRLSRDCDKIYLINDIFMACGRFLGKV